MVIKFLIKEKDLKTKKKQKNKKKTLINIHVKRKIKPHYQVSQESLWIML